MENSSVSVSEDCPVTYCMKMIGGKWKPIILFLITKGVNRFSSLSRGIDGISKHMLTQELRKMENSGILTRTIFPEIPPRVEYELTPFGESLLPVIQSMKKWGEGHMPKTKAV